VNDGIAEPDVLPQFINVSKVKWVELQKSSRMRNLVGVYSSRAILDWSDSGFLGRTSVESCQERDGSK
jgi:hypothetical protein